MGRLRMSVKKIAIIQSNYIPWKGYFDIINMVDEFILLDDVQYTKRDWRNRNKIKTPEGTRWLTIPVMVQGRFLQKIRDVRVADMAWSKRHWTILEQAYRRAPYFQDLRDVFEPLYLNTADSYLSEINFKFITAINRVLGITTPVSRSDIGEEHADPSRRLLALCRRAGAGEYLSGRAAEGYLDMDLLGEEGIRVSWMDYSGYPEYHQQSAPFDHHVSILDLLFNEGPEAGKYMKSVSVSGCI